MVIETRIIVIKTSLTTGMLKKTWLKQKKTWTLRTLVAVEVARDVDALASHHHHFVPYKKKNINIWAPQIPVTLLIITYVLSQMVVHVSFLMVVKLK